jgi:hypothetical protein
MDLPNIFSQSTEMDVKLLICTIMTDTTLQSLLVKVSTQGAKILHRSSVVVYSDELTAVVKMDETLQELGEESEKVTEIIFALDPSWLKNGDVVSAKKPLLHKIVTDLALRPVGFVVISEALVQHSINHNPHFSAILLLLNQSNITVTVATQGKIVSTQTVGRSSDTVADLKEAFARYLQENGEAHLPGKLMCASFALTEEELIGCQQKLLDATWGDKIPFVQTPTIDVVKPDLAVSIIAQQAGQAITAIVNPQSDVVPADNFDFAAVSTEKLKSTKSEERAVEVDHQTLPTSFGIPIKHSMLKDATPEDEERPELAVEVDEPIRKQKKSFMSKLFGSSKNSGHHKYNPKIFIGAGFVAGLLVLVVSGYVWLFFFSSVTVRYKPVAKAIAKEVSLTLDPSITEPDAAALVIPGKKVTVDLSQSTDGTTTGIKIVGDKAKGEVVVYNKTDSQKTFAAGTVFSFDKLQFTSDKDVTVPAAITKEEGNQKTTTYGETKVPVTAYVIGVEGNIPKDSELGVASFDKTSYTSKVVADFTGGTSREIRVVSKEDRELLLSEAKKAMLTEAEKQFEEKSGNGIYILPTTELVISKAVYSAELEAPTEELALKLDGTVTALSYDVADLKPISQAVLSDQVPEGYQLSSEDPEILSAPATTSKDSKAVTLLANISSQAVPKVESSAIQSELVGMSIEKAQEHLQNKKVVTNVEFIFNPPIAQKIVGRLPKNASRITVEEKK